MAITEQQAQGGTIEATWFSTSLADLFPSFMGDIGDIAKTVDGFMPGLQIALNLVTAAQNAAVLIPEIPNVAMLLVNAAVNEAINAIITKIEDLRNAGQSFIVLPPSPGGFRAAGGLIRAALLNTRDPRRPNFGPFSFLAGWGIIAAADVATIQGVIDAIQAIFFASEKLARQANYVKVEATFDFPDPFAASKVLGRSYRVDLPPWISARIVDIIPGADDAFDALIGALRSLKRPPLQLPIRDYLEFLNRIIARIRAILAVVIAIVDLLRKLFVDIPVKVIEFGPQMGSTQDIADSMSAWFNPGQEILADVPDNLYTCGVFAVIGDVTPITVETQLGLLRGLILPTPSSESDASTA